MEIERYETSSHREGNEYHIMVQCGYEHSRYSYRITHRFDMEGDGKAVSVLECDIDGNEHVITLAHVPSRILDFAYTEAEQHWDDIRPKCWHRSSNDPACGGAACFSLRGVR